MRKSNFLLLATASTFLVGIGTAHADDKPDFYTLETTSPGSWWKAESRVLVDWGAGGPKMSGLQCVLKHDRQGMPPMQIAISHPIESARYDFRLGFSLPDTDLISRQVETITVGGRAYQRRSIESRMTAAFGPEREGDDIILAYGLGRDMFRPNEDYPWLPIEFLIPQFFEVEGIFLGVSGEFEIKHGEYEKRYESIYINMAGFKEGMLWCYNQINPSGNRPLKLPSDLTRILKK